MSQGSNIHNDKVLFTRIAAGDQTAFARVFELYYQPLFWHAFKLLKSEFWGEEVIQDIFAQLWTQRQKMGDIENPSAYLYKMVTNKAIDKIKKHKTEIKLQYMMSLHTEGVEAAYKDEKWEQIDAWLQEAVQGLPEQRRRIYELKYQQGLSYDEIAEELSISKNTVRNQMVSALEHIRSFLLEKKMLFLLLLIFLIMYKFL